MNRISKSDKNLVCVSCLVVVLGILYYCITKNTMKVQVIGLCTVIELIFVCNVLEKYVISKKLRTFVYILQMVLFTPLANFGAQILYASTKDFRIEIMCAIVISPVGTLILLASMVMIAVLALVMQYAYDKGNNV